MEVWQSEVVKANGLRLQYRRTGGAKPPVVLLHGFSDAGLCWSSLAHTLAAVYDVVMIDARGHGGSEAPAEGYRAMDHAGDVAGVIAALGLERPIVIGHSMGAITALFLAATYPTLPQAIVLEDPPPWWMGNALFPVVNPAWDAQNRTWLAGLQQQTLAEMITAQRAVAPAWAEDDLAAWAAAKHQIRPHLVGQQVIADDMDWSSLLGKITCPALLLIGDPELDAIITPDQAAALQAEIPQLQVAHIEGTGHSIRRDNGAGYLAAVQPFLAAASASATAERDH